MGHLSTHVLDTVAGKPAAGVAITLDRIAPDGQATRLAEAVTNAKGRTDGPLLDADAMKTGTYELRFAIGAYFRDRGTELPAPAFLDIVPIRFGIADAHSDYHVPLLASPWSYATYRGN